MKTPSPIPLPVTRSLHRLGLGISLARRRRHLSQQDLAERIGASVITIRRMEAGHPGVAFVNRKAPQKQERFDGLVSSSHWPIPNKMHGGDV